MDIKKLLKTPIWKLPDLEDRKRHRFESLNLHVTSGKIECVDYKCCCPKCGCTYFKIVEEVLKTVWFIDDHGYEDEEYESTAKSDYACEDCGETYKEQSNLISEQDWFDKMTIIYILRKENNVDTTKQ